MQSIWQETTRVEEQMIDDGRLARDDRREARCDRKSTETQEEHRQLIHHALTRALPFF